MSLEKSLGFGKFASFAQSADTRNVDVNKAFSADMAPGWSDPSVHPIPPLGPLGQTPKTLEEVANEKKAKPAKEGKGDKADKSGKKADVAEKEADLNLNYTSLQSLERRYADMNKTKGVKGLKTGTLSQWKDGHTYRKTGEGEWTRVADGSKDHGNHDKIEEDAQVASMSDHGKHFLDSRELARIGEEALKRDKTYQILLHGSEKEISDVVVRMDMEEARKYLKLVRMASGEHKFAIFALGARIGANIAE
jgi:hypothetical protein